MSDVALRPLSYPALNRQAFADVESAAHTRGYADGFNEGARKAAAAAAATAAANARAAAATASAVMAAHTHAMAALEAAIVAVNAREAATISEVEETLVAAAVMLAETILGRELSADDNSSFNTASRAISQAHDSIVTRVRLSAEDFANLPSHLEGVELALDRSLQRGDAISEYEHGWLDLRITAALDRARAALTGGAS